MVKKITTAKIIYNYEKDTYEFQLETPLSVCWQVTRKCNLKCKYCLSDSGPKCDIGLNTEDALKVIEQLGKLNVGRLDFTGGEPLLRNDLEILLKRAKELNINTIVTTNSILLNDEKISFLKKYASLVQISIDGPSAVHNDQRGQDVFEKTISNIKLLVKKGIKVRLNSFIYKSNMEYIDYLLNLSKELKVYSHLFILFTPQGRGRNFKEEIIPKDISKKIKKKLIEYKKQNDFYVRLYDYDEYEHSCVLLTPKGDLVSQALFEEDCIKVGNIFENELNVLFQDKAFNQFRHISHYLQRR